MEDNTRICKESNCKSGGAPQPLENFPSNGKGGYRWQCKDCMNNKNKQWRDGHKEHIAKYNKKLRP